MNFTNDNARRLFVYLLAFEWLEAWLKSLSEEDPFRRRLHLFTVRYGSLLGQENDKAKRHRKNQPEKTMKLTRQAILDATAQLTQLGNYAFGSKVRYAIRFNSAKLASLVKIIQAERMAIFEEHAWQHNQANGRFEPADEADRDTTALNTAMTAFLSEEEDITIRTISFDDTGETAFPANLVPDWMMPMPEEEIDTDGEASASNGQAQPEQAISQ